jgi:hypothetical protein
MLEVRLEAADADGEPADHLFDLVEPLFERAFPVHRRTSYDRALKTRSTRMSLVRSLIVYLNLAI